jgi:hypothetical protein
MALNTIDVHGEILAPVTNVPAVGTVQFRIRHELRDTVDNIIYSPITYTATLDVNGEFTITLPVTDDPDVTPLDWSYWVYVDTDVWNPDPFYLQLPSALGPVAEFADLLPLTTGSCTPDGTACAPISVIGEVDALAADLAALSVQLNNIDASQIVSGTLSYQRLGGDIAEADTVVFNRPTLVDPPTAADVWQFQYNGQRVTYLNEYDCLRVRGLDLVQTAARFMSHVNRDGTTLPIFQVSLSNGTTHLFQVLANGDIQASGGLSMLPTGALAVTFNAAGAGNAATINDGNVVNTGAPYPVTTTLEAANRRVHLDGSMANNSGVAIPAQTTLFTVDAAHRPTAWVQFTARTSTNLACRVTVKGLTGAVCIDQSLAAAATLSFDGANWRKN